MTSPPSDHAVDLTNCDREPIHIPGAIQPHGCLLAFSTTNLRLTRWSANAAKWIDEPPRAGIAFDELFAGASGERLGEILSGAAGIVNPLALALRGRDDYFNAGAHHFDGSLIVELERADGGAQRAALASLPLRLNLSNQHLQACGSLDELYNGIAHQVQLISGFDRVMVYRFLEEGHGAVVGEAVDDRFERFLGMHYPATDIPQQARRLYVLNPLRAIADILADPVAIEPQDGAADGRPLDLSYSCYRAVSPIHIEYLHNMGVRASMSVSIVHEGELWGLIACHHYEPRTLSFEQRAACEMLGLVAATYLTAREQDNSNRERSDRRERLAEVMQTVAEADEFGKGVLHSADELCRVVDADGVAFCWRGGFNGWGDLPAEGVIDEIASRALASPDKACRTDRLGEVLGVPPEELHGVCGCLAAPLTAPDLRGVLFFRNEYAREVTWAGNPNKQVTTGQDGARLSPRKSFEQWRETVEGRSREWSPVDIEMADEIRGGMLELLGRRAAQLARINAELTQMNSDLDSFAYAASHDLREPLRGLNHTVFLLQEHLGDQLDDEVARRSENLRRLTGRMEQLVDGLLRLSRAGRGDLEIEAINLEEVAHDALEMACGGVAPEGVSLTVRSDLPVRADYLCLRELLTNLISNAVKYNDQPEKTIEVVCSDSHGYRSAEGETAPVVCVRDNGIGIPADNHEQVFQIFRRLHAQGDYGGGTGAGLTIVKKIVQRHGGRIWIESTPGEGTAFYFTLENAAQ
ncbi:Phytochrome-like protein cph1 [Posidoniimonas polymericola]|uniref:histidine kinase n=1 Tax=Posidoniimonas polymericola TaxID=2528002 RepID=A0A5C5YSX5_9BACT|nr:ATP-binding protein [Posidoniimonas polymericola]TWT78038.1 Phytochrome-like protein cph1 [Posidoniimonas polymericola]